jgi:hypothetical protein
MQWPQRRMGLKIGHLDEFEAIFEIVFDKELKL